MPGREGFIVFGAVRNSDPETVAVLPSSRPFPGEP